MKIRIAFFLVVMTIAIAQPLGTRAGAVAATETTPRYHTELKIEPATPIAGQPVELIFYVKNQVGKNVPFLQIVHEKPMHLLMVSEDLAEFYHIHPERKMDDSYRVAHIFPHGGRYSLFADYTPPGSGQIVQRYTLMVIGKVRPDEDLVADQQSTQSANGLRVTMSADKPWRAGEDLALKFTVADAKSWEPVNDLQLYLGAQAHFVIINEGRKDFLHAHPLDDTEVFIPAELAKQLGGPRLSEVRAHVSFPRAGLYKLWAQFQRNDRIIVVPFVFQVAEAAPVARREIVIPADAIRVRVGASGYEPAVVQVKKGQPVKLAFTRAGASGCGGMVVFPTLGIRRHLHPGETVLIEITPTETGELSFTCGMRMYKGSLVVNP